MFKAIGGDDKKVLVENAIKGNKYFCPICGEPLIIRAENSLAVSKHFAHKKGTQCLDDWSYDMSEWHKSWQDKFPEECREVIIEKNGIKHRADILINNTVIEFQHSPITNQEILKRNEFYLSCGYRVVWVFDAKDKIKNQYNDFIDPMRCRSGDLCWKRDKSQFASKFQRGVTVYLQYKTTVSVRGYEGKEFDILLLLTETDSKYFTFLPTKTYILENNFLQEYGVNTGAYSISQIISQAYQQKHPTYNTAYTLRTVANITREKNGRYRRL